MGTSACVNREEGGIARMGSHTMDGREEAGLGRVVQPFREDQWLFVDALVDRKNMRFINQWS
jgi:hypothetical protein